MLPTTPTRTDSRANNRVVDSVPARGRVCAHLFFFSKCFAWNLALIPGWSTARRAQGMSYDHTTVIIPHPIRTAKSSTVGPNQYCGGGPRGNLGCRMFFFGADLWRILGISYLFSHFFFVLIQDSAELFFLAFTHFLVDLQDSRYFIVFSASESNACRTHLQTEEKKKKKKTNRQTKAKSHAIVTTR